MPNDSNTKKTTRTKKRNTPSKTRRRERIKTSSSPKSPKLEKIVFVSSDENVDYRLLKSTRMLEHIVLQDTGLSIIMTHNRYDQQVLKETKKQVFSQGARATLDAYFLFVCRQVANDGMILYHHASKVFELARELILTSRLPYGIMMSSDISCNWLQQHFVASSKMCFTFNPQTRANWRGRYVFNCHLLDEDTISDSLLACAQRTHIVTTKQTKRQTAPLSALLVSYYMPPSETVAVHRLSYWHESLPKIAQAHGEELSVSVLTAINAYENDDKYHVAPDLGGFGVNDASASELVDRAKNAKVNYFAAYWAAHVRDYFDSNPDIKFDSIVLSGNPFYYFELGAYFKEKWNAQIILDFRDPFANNPRFVYSEPHAKLVAELEDSYIQSADYVLSVNQHCLDSLRLPDKRMGHVIANGYDERIVDEIAALPLKQENEKIKFVYTGSFYADRNPEPFLASLEENSHTLIHIGRQAESDSHLDDYAAIERYGLMPYEDVIAYCRSIHAGIIFTSGKAFEQTTKIFDYIATGIDIILVTDGEVRTGELENITKDLTGVYWVKNNPKDIEKFLASYKPNNNRREVATTFSRKSQTEKLYALLKTKQKRHR